MKLQTSIQPRRDGTVKVVGQDQKTYVFEADADGELSCDISDMPTVSALLSGGLFWPANQEDHDAALAAVETTRDDDEGEDGKDGDDGDDDLSDEALVGALPIEANTPLAPARRKPGPKPKQKTE